MRKIKEVPRLHYEVKLHQRQITGSCGISQATVHEYLKRAEAAGLSWPLPEGCDEIQLQKKLFGAEPALQAESRRTGSDFTAIREQLQKHSHLTLLLLWQEYRERHPDGYGYSRFCELYQRWRRQQDVVLRQQYRAGEKLFVDWAGTCRYQSVKSILEKSLDRQPLPEPASLPVPPLGPPHDNVRGAEYHH